MIAQTSPWRQTNKQKPGGRPVKNNYELMGFELLKSDISRKYSVYCYGCHKVLKNTAENRLIRHRNHCKLCHEDENVIDLLDDSQDDQYEKSNTINNNDVELDLTNTCDTIAEIQSINVADVDVDEQPILSSNNAYDTALSNNTTFFHKCIVPQCGTKTGTSMHRLPKEHKLRSQWIKKLKLNTKYINESVSVCGHHFDQNDFHFNIGQNPWQLKEMVVPSQRLPKDPSYTNNNYNLEQYPAIRKHEFEDIYRKLTVDNNAKFRLDKEEYNDGNNESLNDSDSIETIWMKQGCSDVSDDKEPEYILPEPIQKCNDSSIQINTTDNYKLKNSPFKDSLTTISDLIAWTHLPNFAYLKAIEKCVKNIKNAEENLKQFKVSIEELIILVMVKIKVNLSYKQMATLFKLTELTVSNYFSKFLPILKTSLKTIFWPTRNPYLKNLSKDYHIIVFNIGIRMKAHLTVNKDGQIINVSSIYSVKRSNNNIPLYGIHKESDAVMDDSGYEPSISSRVTTANNGDNKLMPWPLPQPQRCVVENDAVKSVRQRLQLFKIFHYKITTSIANDLDDILFVTCCVVNINTKK